MSDWFITSTGRRVHVLTPRPGDIDIEDIAHALAHVCRFGGHTLRFYSVAEHSILVSRLVPPECALQGLLHDASEAYLGDVIRPLKNQLRVYKDIEARWEAAIAEHFDLPWPLEPAVKRADMIALVTERRDLIAEPPVGDGLPWIKDELRVEPAPVPCMGWRPKRAQRLFLQRFQELT